jgi:hypothetical protein
MPTSVHAELELARRHPGPALERLEERRRLGEAEQVRDLARRDRAARQVPLGELLADRRQQIIGQSTDEGFYVQGMVHIKQQGVTNEDTGDHVNLSSLAVGLELGYVWKVYQGLYVAPRVGALYYIDKPQPGNDPVQVGDRTYDNSRHRNWDTYYIPTVSVGYSW